MRKLAIPAGLLLVLLVAIVPATAITWGQPDTDGLYPNVGAMVVDWPGEGPYQWCSGTLIHERVFLTAGHCTDGLDEYGITRVWVNFDRDAVNPDTLLLVDQVITHPEFEWGGANPHDVGALVLAQPVTDIAPAELPVEGFLEQLKRDRVLRSGGPDGAMFTVVGYGGTLNWPPPDITYDDERQYAESEYVALTKPWLHMNQNRLKDNGGTCFGDSGGPAFWVENGTETLVGLTSWGDAQCVVAGFDYRVDIPETLDFVDWVIANLP